jgi:hypothetical protein
MFSEQSKNESLDDLLKSTEFTTRAWDKSFNEEWCRLILLIRFVYESEKSKPKSDSSHDVLREFLDDVLRYITEKDKGSDVIAYNNFSKAVDALPDDNDKRKKQRMSSLINLISPSDKQRLFDKRKEDKQHQSSSSSSSSSSYNKYPRSQRTTYRDGGHPYMPAAGPQMPYPQQQYMHQQQYTNAQQPSPAPYNPHACPTCGKIHGGVCRMLQNSNYQQPRRPVTQNAHEQTQTIRNDTANNALILTHSNNNYQHVQNTQPHPLTRTHQLTSPHTINQQHIDCHSHTHNANRPAYASHISTSFEDNNNQRSAASSASLHAQMNGKYINHIHNSSTHDTVVANDHIVMSVDLSTPLSLTSEAFVTIDDDDIVAETSITNNTNSNTINTNANTQNDNNNILLTQSKNKHTLIPSTHAQTIANNASDIATTRFDVPLGPGNSMRKANAPIRKMLGFDKKNFSTRDKHCEYCEQVGHTASFCAKRPSNPMSNATLSADKQLYVQTLLDKPQISLDTFEKCDMSEAMAIVHSMGASLNAGNPWASSSEPRDQLRAKLGYWKAIGANREVISWIAYGIEMRFEAEPDHIEFKNHPSYHEHLSHVDAEHERHVATGSWRLVPRSYAKIVNPLQVEVNTRGKKRMCVDMRYPNSFTADCKFKLETLHTHLTQVVEKGDVMFSTDMEQAYYSMAMNEHSWPYMVWKHRDKYYCSTILTFGYNQAPLIFHKTMRVIVRFSRTLGLQVLNYLDDYLWSCKLNRSALTVAFVKDLLPLLGWRFNAKCRFDPTPEIEFLGMIINAEKYWITAPSDKIDRIKSLCTEMQEQIINHKSITVLSLQVLASTIRSVKLAVTPASTWTREMNTLIAIATDACTTYINAQVYDVSKLESELTFWLSRIQYHNGAGMDHPLHQLTVYCDASVTGYGGTCGSTRVSQVLPTYMIGTSSTHRELFGLIAVTNTLADTLTNKRVRFVMDSQPAIANLTNGGGPVPALNDEIKRFKTLCFGLKIEASFEWIPREVNVEADELSKANEFKHSLEFILPSHYALAMQFANYHGLSAFEAPSFNSIDFRIRSIISDRSRVCMIIPEWHAQAWWPDVMRRDRPAHKLGNTRQVYDTTQQTYAQANGFNKNIPLWNVWIVVYDASKL